MSGRTQEHVRTRVVAWQVAIVLIVLAAWQWLPTIEALSERYKFLNPFFISSPDRIVTRLYEMATGSNDTATFWPYLWPTLLAASLGIVIGMTLGILAGLLLSNSPFAAAVVAPLLSALNAVPRIALIPIFIILFGPTLNASVVMAVTITFFVSFFNAYEGGRTVPGALVANSVILGARPWQVMLRIRLPYVVAWTVAALPLAVTFALLTVVTTEVLTGYNGMGYLLATATVTANSSLTFAVVVILSALGLGAAGLAQLVKSKALHWWGDTTSH